MTDKGNTKGARAEEAIRNAFIRAGYYVVRAIPYTFQGHDVTDVDLWLYGMAGAFRERINVDIKNKKTPQAIERFFWALGVMQVLRLDRCIVVTTERNPAVIEFGRRNNVAVIDGHFLQDAQAAPNAGRLSEEEFLVAICPVNAEEMGKALRQRYQSAKSRLLTQMTFDGCNLHLIGVQTCLNELLAYPGTRLSVRRVLYAMLSYVAVTVDYLMTKMEFTDPGMRKVAIETGLRYGNAGAHRLDGFIKILESCKSQERQEDNEVIARIVKMLKAGAADLRVDMIAEFTTNLANNAGLLMLAIQFEACAFAVNCMPISALPYELKSFLLMLVDFYGLDRKALMTC